MKRVIAACFFQTLHFQIGSTIAAGDKVILPGFGTFEVRQRPARQDRNPSTGEAVMIAAKKAPAFKPGKVLKNKVNG